MQGSHFRISFDGRRLFEANDGDIRNAGKVGVGTKADSVTSFDDLKIEGHDSN